jgi:hypothetical protein
MTVTQTKPPAVDTAHRAWGSQARGYALPARSRGVSKPSLGMSRYGRRRDHRIIKRPISNTTMAMSICHSIDSPQPEVGGLSSGEHVAPSGVSLKRADDEARSIKPRKSKC